MKQSVVGVLGLVGMGVFGCSGEDAKVVLEGQGEPLGGFQLDTGMVPASGAAQVQLLVSAGGPLTVRATARVEDEQLVAESGEISLDVHLGFDGRLKVDASPISYDGDLPGLADIDIPISAKASFDPGFVGEGHQVTAEIPETELPEIPLGATPGSLVLRTAPGSTLSSTFQGSCLQVRGEKVSYEGSIETVGHIVLHGEVKAEVAGFSKSFDLGDIALDIPALSALVTFSEVAAPDAADAKEGSCGKDPDPTAGAGGASSSSGSAQGGASSSGEGGSSSGDGSGGASSSSGSGGAGPVANITVDGVPMTVTSFNLWPPTSDAGTMVFIRFEGPGMPDGSDVHLELFALDGGCNLNDIWLRPAVDSTYPDQYTSDDPACGLWITGIPAGPGELAEGSFYGWLDSLQSWTMPEQAYVELDFSVPWR